MSSAGASPAFWSSKRVKGASNQRRVPAHPVWPNVVSVRVYLLDFDRDYTAMNSVYATYFPPGRLPARTCVGVSGLAKGALIEIDLVARRPLA